MLIHLLWLCRNVLSIRDSVWCSFSYSGCVEVWLTVCLLVCDSVRCIPLLWLCRRSVSLYIIDCGYMCLSLVGVRVRHGERECELYSRLIISDAGVPNTFLNLLPKEIAAKTSKATMSTWMKEFLILRRKKEKNMAVTQTHWIMQLHYILISSKEETRHPDLREFSVRTLTQPYQLIT